MAFVSKGHRILDRGYRLIIDHLPGDEEKIINFLKRLIPIAWLGTMVFATLIVTFIVSIQVTSDSEVFVAQYTIENYRIMYRS